MEAPDAYGWPCDCDLHRKKDTGGELNSSWQPAGSSGDGNYLPSPKLELMAAKGESLFWEWPSRPGPRIPGSSGVFRPVASGAMGSSRGRGSYPGLRHPGCAGGRSIQPQHREACSMGDWRLQSAELWPAVERSPIATMNFSGKYQLQSEENFEPFMKAMGIPDDLIQKGKGLKGSTEIVQNGKHFKITMTIGTRVNKHEFTLGEESEMETITGEKVKALVNLDGDNKLVATFKNTKSVTELSGDTLTSTMTVGDIVFKRISKRI
ncbi:uncharacterized protein LOC104863271 [Fukomys damarensis]|uniref:uncharacterized protein LOC104863271 n=1 Tax=Fukomys damarensis TaxID=885580 RepID=UPI00053FDA8F|nr:uncharacterized protein LOC104863271 [Fukomys damarensis]